MLRRLEEGDLLGPVVHTFPDPQHTRFLLAPSLAHELIRLHSSLSKKSGRER